MRCDSGVIATLRNRGIGSWQASIILTDGWGERFTQLNSSRRRKEEVLLLRSLVGDEVIFLRNLYFLVNLLDGIYKNQSM